MNLVTKLTKIWIWRILMIISCFQKELSPIFKTFRNINSSSSTSTSSWNQQSLSKFQLGYMGDMKTIARTSDFNSVSSINILTFLVFSFLFVSIHSQDNVQRCRGSSVKGRCSGQSNNGTICQIKNMAPTLPLPVTVNTNWNKGLSWKFSQTCEKSGHWASNLNQRKNLTSQSLT